MQNPIILETVEEPEKKAHPWRRCAMGKHADSRWYSSLPE